MPSTAEWQVHHLSNFFVSGITPFLSALKLADQPLEHRLSQGTLLEAMLWLHLGSVLGYFPKDDAMRLIRQLTLELQFDQSSLTYWTARFSGIAQRIVESALGGTNLFEQEFGARFLAPEELLNAFQACLHASTSFWKIATARLLSAVLAFYTPRDWEAIDRSRINSDNVATYLATDPVVIIELWPALCAGLIQTIDHMSFYRSFFTECFVPEAFQGTLQEDGLALRRRVGQIQRWRFDFENLETMERFSECRKTVGSLLFQGHEELFRSAVLEITNDWHERGGATKPSSRQAQA